MVDIIIEADATAGPTHFMRQIMNGRDCVDAGSKRYQFYLDNEGQDLEYRQSLDEGETYGSAVSVYSNAIDTLKKVSIHFDQWTRNDFGVFIHIFLLARGAGGSHTEVYRLNTTTEVLTGPFDFLPTSGGVSGNIGWVGVSRSTLGVTKSEDGCYHAVGWIDNGVGDGFHAVSTDGIVWDDSTHQSLQDATPTEGNSALKVLLVTDNDDADDRDIWAIIMDETPRVLVRKYDFSTLTWGAQNVVQAVATNSDVYFQMAVTQYFSTRSHFLVFWTDFNVATADYVCYELESSTTFTLRTAVLTNFNFTFGAGIFCDQATGDFYAGHFNGTPEATVSVFQDINTTGGVGAWVRSQYSEGVADDHRWLSIPPSGSATGARWMPAWRNDDLSDIISNFDVSTPVGPVPGPPPEDVEPPPVVPGGGTFEDGKGGPPSLRGGSAGFLLYITPDGREYPLHTPHDFGRWVISYAGFGTPPIQYVSERGPLQHGETVKDFFLRPRVIQLLIRQGFANRSAWWQGRGALLDELRPNRQVSPTRPPLPGQLRLTQTDGTVRDLDVFLQEGPRFEPRVSNQWDEWAFQEVVRFVAHNPVAFDPDSIAAAVALGVSADLVFPITFDDAVVFDDIIFGSGEIDATLNINYLGTWLELPVITIAGPFEDLIIENTTTNEKIEFSSVLEPGRTVTVDLREDAKTIEDDLGNNLIADLTNDSDLATWHLAPDPEAPLGVNVMRVRGTNPTGASSVTFTYFNRYIGF